MEGSTKSNSHSELSSIPTADIIRRILDELKSPALDSDNVICTAEIENRFVQRCILSVLLGILLEENAELTPSLVRTACIELASSFKRKLMLKLWKSVDSSRRSGILYGLILLVASRCQDIREKARESVKNLLDCDFYFRRWNRTHYNTLRCVLRDIQASKDEFQGIAQNWVEVKKEMKLENEVELINLVVSFVDDDGDDPYIVGSVWCVLSYYVLHCQHLEMLVYLYERAGMLPHDPSCEAVVSEDPLSVWVYRLIQDELGYSSIANPVEEHGDLAKQLALCLTEYDNSKMNFFCSFLLRLVMADTKQNDLVISIVMAAEDLHPGAKIWVGGEASLFDSLILVLEEYIDVKAKRGVLKTLKFWFYRTTWSTSIKDVVTTLVEIYSADANGVDVQLLSGQCLLRLFDSEFFYLSDDFRRRILGKMPKFSDMRPELKEIHQQLIDMLKTGLETSLARIHI